MKEWHAWSHMFATWFSKQFTNDEDTLDWATGEGVEVARINAL